MLPLAIAIVLGAADVTHPVYPPAYSADGLDGLKKSVADAHPSMPVETIASRAQPTSP